jgi:hypothetical protein
VSLSPAFSPKNIANGNTALRNIFKLFVDFIQDTNTQKEKAMKTYLTIYGAMTFGQKSFEWQTFGWQTFGSTYKDVILSFGRQTIGQPVSFLNVFHINGFWPKDAELIMKTESTETFQKRPLLRSGSIL